MKNLDTWNHNWSSKKYKITNSIVSDCSNSTFGSRRLLRRRRYGRRVEIVAKLLSVSLIGDELEYAKNDAINQCLGDKCDQTLETETETNRYKKPQLEGEVATKQFCEDEEREHQRFPGMVYSDTCFLNIREEYPNLDKEVRSLLLTHAQYGATISEIIGKHSTHKLIFI